MSVTVQVSGDALPWLQRLEAAQNAPRLRKVMAAEAAKTFRSHFAKLDRQRHGGGAHHYYGQAARATTSAVRGNDMFVIVDQVGIAQRYFGGVIRAKPGKALTIPVRGSEAEGRRASEFDNLFVARSKKGNGFLARLDAAGELEPLYWLRKSVTQKADPSVLPTEDKLNTRMGEAMTRELDRL